MNIDEYCPFQNIGQYSYNNYIIAPDNETLKMNSITILPSFSLNWLVLYILFDVIVEMVSSSIVV